MSDLTLSWHYLATDSLPVVSSRAKLRDAVGQLQGQGAGSFLMLRPGNELVYVKAEHFANRCLESAGSASEVDAMLEAPIGELIDQNPRPEEFLIRVEPTAIEPKEDEVKLRSQPDAVFRVNRGTTHIGYYLNHETVRTTATGRPVWICEFGHVNVDPDHGRCGACPGRLSSLKTQTATAGTAARTPVGA